MSLTDVSVRKVKASGKTRNFFSVRSFTRTSPEEFDAIVDIGELVGEKPKLVRVSHHTNAGMGEFLIESR